MVEPTGYTALDMIGFTDKGQYDPLENYVKNDIVHDADEKMWLCKVDDTRGVTPAEGVSWTKYIAPPVANPETIGIGYGTCSTAASTTAKEVTLSGYNLKQNGYVSVLFTYAVPASATLNVNSKGAKPIYYHGSAITADIIGAGDLATFVYDGTNYNFVGVDNVSSQIQALTNEADDISAEIAGMNNVLDAKNLLPVDYPAIGKTITSNGITCMITSDGEFILSGTATGGDAIFDILDYQKVQKNLNLELGEHYILSGMPENDKGIILRLSQYYNGAYHRSIDTGAGVEFTFQAEDIKTQITKFGCIILIPQYTVLSTQFIVKPMIRNAFIKDDTFAPYTKTNRQLTNMLTLDFAHKQDISSLLSFTPKVDGMLFISTFIQLNNPQAQRPTARFVLQIDEWVIYADAAPTVSTGQSWRKGSVLLNAFNTYSVTENDGWDSFNMIFVPFLTA